MAKKKPMVDDFFEEMETVRAMEATYSGDVDMPEDVPLIEQSYELSEEEDVFDDEEVEAYLENVNFEDSKLDGLSFDDLVPKNVPESGVKCQLKENIVQPHFLVLREFVERTPSVCVYRDCFYDGAKAIKFKNWHKVPVNKRKIALIALERHVQLRHKFRDTDIVDKAHIPTSWLSPTI